VRRESGRGAACVCGLCGGSDVRTHSHRSPQPSTPFPAYRSYKASQKRLSLLSSSFEERCHEVEGLQNRCRELTAQLQAAQAAASSAQAVAAAASGIPFLGGTRNHSSDAEAGGSGNSSSSSLGGLKLTQLLAAERAAERAPPLGAASSGLSLALPASPQHARRLSQADESPPLPSPSPTITIVIKEPAQAPMTNSGIARSRSTRLPPATPERATASVSSPHPSGLDTPRAAGGGSTALQPSRSSQLPPRPETAAKAGGGAGTPSGGSAAAATASKRVAGGPPPIPALPFSLEPAPAPTSSSLGGAAAAAALTGTAAVAAASSAFGTAGVVAAGAAASLAVAPVAAVAVGAVAAAAVGSALLGSGSSPAAHSGGGTTASSFKDAPAYVPSNNPFGPPSATSPPGAAARAAPASGKSGGASNPFAPHSASGGNSNPFAPGAAASAAAATSGKAAFATAAQQAKFNAAAAAISKPPPRKGAAAAAAAGSDDDSGGDDESGSDSEGGPSSGSATPASPSNPFRPGGGADGGAGGGASLFKVGGLDPRADMGSARKALLPAEQAFHVPFPVLGAPAHVRARVPARKSLLGGLSGGGGGSWSARYVAAGRGQLSYFLKEGDSAPKSRLDLRAVVDAEVAPFSEVGRAHSLVLVTRDGGGGKGGKPAPGGVYISFGSEAVRDAFLALLLGVVHANKEAWGLA
jgi:hypothetical protein